MYKKISSIPLVILCGGKSSRMESDKSLIPFGKHPTLIQYQYAKYSLVFENIYLSTKENKFEFINSENIIIDKNPIFSPMVALNSVFEYLNEEKIFVITVDMPLIDINTIYKTIDFSLNSNYEIIVAKDEKYTHNLCGIFHKSIKNKIEYCLINNIHKINYLIKDSNHYEFFIENNQQFLNINFPNDYEIAKNILDKKE